MAAVWHRTAEGYAVRHTLVGTSFSVLASGGRTVSGYGAGGRARMTGSARSFDLYDGDRCIGYRPTLAVAKAHAERRAGVSA